MQFIGSPTEGDKHKAVVIGESYSEFVTYRQIQLKTRPGLTRPEAFNSTREKLNHTLTLLLISTKINEMFKLAGNPFGRHCT